MSQQSVVERLGPIEVLDLDEKRVRMAEAWRDQTVVLVFIRHFG